MLAKQLPQKGPLKRISAGKTFEEELKKIEEVNVRTDYRKDDNVQNSQSNIA